MPIRVLIVDDHVLLRRLLADRLAREDSMRVVGTVGSGDEAIELSATNSPDVVVMDVDLPGRDAFEAARQILTDSPGSRILFLSAFARDHYIDQALALGAKGYVTLRETPDTLVAAIQGVAEDRPVFSDDVRRRIVFESNGRAKRAGARSRSALLTPRERDVLRYIARGYSKRDIAAMLNISLKTVEKHTENLMGRLEIHDRVKLARFAIREGIVEA